MKSVVKMGYGVETNEAAWEILRMVEFHGVLLSFTDMLKDVSYRCSRYSDIADINRFGLRMATL